jgi:hypothetical protein
MVSFVIFIYLFMVSFVGRPPLLLSVTWDDPLSGEKQIEKEHEQLLLERRLTASAAASDLALAQNNPKDARRRPGLTGRLASCLSHQKIISGGNSPYDETLFELPPEWTLIGTRPRRPQAAPTTLTI